MPENAPIIAGTRIGHVHLKVADLDRALGFYCGVLGFEVMQRMGSGAAFISAGGYHHHIGLNTAINQVTYAFGPGVVGALRDWSGGYALPFYLCIALEVMAAALIMVRGKPL